MSFNIRERICLNKLDICKENRKIADPVPTENSKNSLITQKRVRLNNNWELTRTVVRISAIQLVW